MKLTKSLRRIKNVFTVILALFPLFILGQNVDKQDIKEFADHLFEEGDYIRAAMEYEKYNYYSSTISDSILFKIGICHQLRDNYRFAEEKFRKIVEEDSSQLTSTARLALLYNLYKNKQWAKIKNIGYNSDEEFYFYYQASLHDSSIRNIQQDFEQIKDDSLRNIYQTLHKRKQELPQKSSFLSGALSAIIPGLGKVYINRAGDGLFSFIMTNFASFTAYRAFETELVVTGVVTSGIALSFYLGTVYGSYIGANIYNQNIENKWERKVANLNPTKQNPYWEKWIKN